MSAVFFKYFLGQWKLYKIDQAYVLAMIDAGRLTEEEALEIINTPR